MSENRYPKEEELFDAVRKLFNLKSTDFIVDPESTRYIGKRRHNEWKRLC